MVGGLALLFALRRRAVKTISTRLQVPMLDALTILNTPSWRVSAWRRAIGQLTRADSPRIRSNIWTLRFLY